MEVRKMRSWWCIGFLTTAAMFYPGNVAAQQATQDTTQQAEDVVPIEGPSGVTAEVDRSLQERESLLGAPLQRYLAWKQQLREKTGFSYTLMGLSTYQLASKSTTDNRDGFGQWYRLGTTWTLVGRGTGSSGGIEVRGEYRSNIGSFISPTRLGAEVGAAALNPGFGFVDQFDFDVPVLNWTQFLFDNHFGMAVGRLAFDAYLDGSPVQSLTRGFANRSFGLNPALGITGLGALGAVAKADVVKGFWVGAHIYDANARSSEFNKDVFEQSEWLKVVEVGWTPSTGELYPVDRVNFTYWRKDERVDAGVPSGHGWALSASHRVGERFLPFIRLGRSDGGGGVAAKTAVSGGFELAMPRDRAWALGLGWARPVPNAMTADPRDEYVTETSYRFNLTQAFQVLLDAQVLFNPANNPDASSVWVFGVRVVLQL